MVGFYIFRYKNEEGSTFNSTSALSTYVMVVVDSIKEQSEQELLGTSEVQTEHTDNAFTIICKVCKHND